MTIQRQVKLTRTEDGETVSIPQEFALSSDDVIISKEGDRLVIEPRQPRNRRVNDKLLAWLATQEPLPPDALPAPVQRHGLARPVQL